MRGCARLKFLARCENGLSFGAKIRKSLVKILASGMGGAGPSAFRPVPGSRSPKLRELDFTLYVWLQTTSQGVCQGQPKVIHKKRLK